MTHKYASGQNVYYEPTFGNAAARGKYKVVRALPVENDNRLSYRIKSIAETFERIAEAFSAKIAKRSSTVSSAPPTSPALTMFT